MSEENIPIDEARPEAEEEQRRYEGTPEELTGFQSGPAWFDRKKAMIAISFAFAAVLMGSILFSAIRSKAERNKAEHESGQAAQTPSGFLQTELNRSLRNGQIVEGADASEAAEHSQDNELPTVVPVSYEQRTSDLIRAENNPPPPPAPPTPPGPGGGAERDYVYTANFSPLVPSIEGGLFGASAQRQQGSYAEQYPYAAQPSGYPQNAPAPPLQGQAPDAFAAQNNQADKRDFYGSAAGGYTSGVFLSDDLVWIGTIIPAVLETSINTDLPGNVIARVSQNVYDSRTGKKLLIPQGTTLVAQYNSSVSYAQRRVQIVWDLLIRPDGYQLELGGMNGVDTRGMAGLKAEYRENWFEYLKAAGVIAMFSIANGKMAEEAAKYGSNEMAAGVVSSNAQFVNQLGGGIVGRAMNIQPTLIIQNGEKINVMLNKNIYLPAVEDYPVTQKYSLK